MSQYSRFTYVRYDDAAASAQAEIKERCEALEAEILVRLPAGRARELALKALEEAYMWCGKGLRDAQVARTGEAAEEPRRGEKLAAHKIGNIYPSSSEAGPGKGAGTVEYLSDGTPVRRR